jgi:hypothetical protein
MTSDTSNTTNNNELFVSTSNDYIIQILHVSFANQDPSASLGVQLINMDVPEREIESMFTPGYAIVGRLLPPPQSTLSSSSTEEETAKTIAQIYNVHSSDILVAINGHGFRRFALESTDSIVVLNAEDTMVPNVDMDHAVVTSTPQHESDTDTSAYHQLMAKLKAVKAANGDPPLIITMERYGTVTSPPL